MLHTNKQSIAEELNVHRTCITRMIKRGEVKVLYNTLGKKHYVHIINLIKELVG